MANDLWTVLQLVVAKGYCAIIQPGLEAWSLAPQADQITEAAR